MTEIFRSLKGITFARLDRELLDLNGLNATLTLYWHPGFLEDIGLFLQFYKGKDPYRIYYHYNISAIRFSLMTEIISFIHYKGLCKTSNHIP